MILYLDTSALVKLYAVEEGREVVERGVEEAELVATSVVAYAEAREAGDLAEEHALRGFDAIHLASALLVRDAYSAQGDEEDEETVLFLAFDSNLTQAAGKVMQVSESGEEPNGQTRS